MPNPVQIRELYSLLAQNVPTGTWWPADSPFEIIVGAILTQNTAWTNVERAISNLRQAGALTPEAIADLSVDQLGQLIRPSGYFSTKARYLQAITTWFQTHHETVPDNTTAEVRTSLMEVIGVGDETADSILLYVYDRPMFIYDLYARRLIAAAGWGSYTTYRQAKRALDPTVDSCCFTASELSHFHGLIVDAGKLAASLGGWDAAYPHLVAGTFHGGPT